MSLFSISKAHTDHCDKILSILKRHTITPQTLTFIEFMALFIDSHSLLQNFTETVSYGRVGTDYSDCLYSPSDMVYPVFYCHIVAGGRLLLKQIAVAAGEKHGMPSSNSFPVRKRGFPPSFLSLRLREELHLILHDILSSSILYLTHRKCQFHHVQCTISL